MWKSTKDDKPMPVAAPSPSTPLTLNSDMKKELRPMEIKQPEKFSNNDVAHIGKSVVVKGELSGSEDLYLDGEVEGSIDLQDHSLTIGPHGRVRANVKARDVVVHGKVDGNVQGTDRVELKRSAVVTGDVHTQRIVIEDGAFFKGAIDIKKDAPKAAGKPDAAKEHAKTEPAKAFAAAASESSYSPHVLSEKKY
jgi:cytoskeletal protein CcmA (bactofilin family)